MSMVEKARALGERHGSKVEKLAIALVLAGTTGAVGMLWNLNGQMHAFAARQSATTQAIKVRAQVVDSKLKRLERDQQTQGDHIDANRQRAEQNSQSISVLKNRVDHVERQRAKKR
ncbi:hypothetical protein HKX42_00180 [Salinisphaera sp. USBA-960]|nr:hypothetical protein [Salifodinibacter halophilus]NNC25308.1 hypothetical protein [Salifodinibacter halophilus]